MTLQARPSDQTIGTAEGATGPVPRLSASWDSLWWQWSWARRDAGRHLRFHWSIRHGHSSGYLPWSDLHSFPQIPKPV